MILRLERPALFSPPTSSSQVSQHQSVRSRKTVATQLAATSRCRRRLSFTMSLVRLPRTSSALERTPGMHAVPSASEKHTQIITTLGLISCISTAIPKKTTAARLRRGVSSLVRRARACNLTPQQPYSPRSFLGQLPDRVEEAACQCARLSSSLDGGRAGPRALQC